MTAAGVLVASPVVTGPAHAAPASAALPPLPSTAAPLQPPELPAGDFSNPPGSTPVVPTLAPPIAAPPGLDLAGKTLTQRSASADFYDNHDGTRTAVVHGTAVNWQDASGTWRPIDPRLTASAGGGWHNASGPVSVSVSGASGPDFVRASGTGWSAAFSLLSALPGKAGVVSGATVTYADVLPGVDISETVLPGSLKEEVVLKATPALGVPSSFRFPLHLAGLTPSQATPDSRIDFADATGAVVASIPQGYAIDSSVADASATPPMSLVHLALVRPTPASWAVDVALDGAWLADPARVYPVRIDPTYTFEAGISSGHWDTFNSQAQPNTNFVSYDATGEGLAAYIDKIGIPSVGQQFYSYLKYDFSPLHGHQIIGGTGLWNGYFFDANTYTGNSFAIYQVTGGPWTDQTLTWNTMPNHCSCTPALGATGSANQWVQRDISGWLQGWADTPSTNYGISMDTRGLGYYFRMAAVEQYPLGEDSYVQANYTENPPSAAAAASPADGTVTVSPTPTLSVNTATDPDSDPVQYWFTVSGAGARVDSGWVSSTSWQVPPNVLQDGVTYTWSVTTQDTPYGMQTAPGWSRSFKVDQRLGDVGPVPYDHVGPVSVNLFNGNAVVHAASPSFPAVGGSVGLTYTYNAQASSPAGLTGSYASNCTTPLGAWPAFNLVRRDPQVNFSWAAGSAGSMISTDNVCARWTGFVTAPTTDTYNFGAVSDDGARIWVNGTQVLNNWVDQGAGAPVYGTGIALTAGTPVPIQVDYYEHAGSSTVQLYAKAASSPESIVPTSWLSTDAPALPQGWSVSADLDGNLAYTRARVNEASVTLVDSSGTTHTYTQSGTSYVPPLNEDAVLTKDASTGLLTLHDTDGQTYVYARPPALKKTEA